MDHSQRPERPYLAFGGHLRARFGCKVYRVGLNAGFSCPNRDGTVGEGGCIYCRIDAFTLGQGGAGKSIREQMLEGMSRVGRRYGAGKFLAYFQAFTNTYAPLPVLRAAYDESLVSEDVVGLCIGTRPDCVADPVLSLVADYALRMEVWLEFGLQSANDATLERINRGHDFACFADAVRRARERGIMVCAHVILGLPGENRKAMMRTADALAEIGIDGVKIHHLHVVRGTPLEEMYARGEVSVFPVEEYVPLVVDFLERIPADAVIHRLMGECRGDLLIAPLWRTPKREVVRMIEEEFHRRGTRQGARCAG